MPNEDVDVMGLIDAVLMQPVSSSTKSELRSFRSQAETGTLDHDDRKYVVALCNRFLDRAGSSYRYPEPSGGASEKLNPVPGSGSIGRAVETLVKFPLALVKFSLALVLFVALPVLLIYGVILIIFRSAFDVELPNPLHWFSRH
jgi:hypothetical protein